VVLTAIGTVAAVIAALAALATVIYARRTVLDGHTAHRELMTAQAQARSDLTTANTAQLAAQAQTADAFAAAHAEEMEARERALAAETSLQRLVQADRLAAALADMARTAHQETLAPPLVIAGRRGTFIPALQAQLRASLALFYALGGPPLERSDDRLLVAVRAAALRILRGDRDPSGEPGRLPNAERREARVAGRQARAARLAARRDQLRAGNPAPGRGADPPSGQSRPAGLR
jgi:hypothetical protein